MSAVYDNFPQTSYVDSLLLGGLYRCLRSLCAYVLHRIDSLRCSSRVAPGRLELRLGSCGKESDRFRTKPELEHQGGNTRAEAPGLVLQSWCARGGWSNGPLVVKNRTSSERDLGWSIRAAAPGPKHQGWCSNLGAPGLELRPASCSKGSDHSRTGPGRSTRAGAFGPEHQAWCSSLGASELDLRPASCCKESDHFRTEPRL